MTNYSLIKVGNDYVVRADDQSILKVASRRRAASLINDALSLLNAQAAAEAPIEIADAPSIHCEEPEAP
jgi:hypothetical protein